MQLQIKDAFNVQYWMYMRQTVSNSLLR